MGTGIDSANWRITHNRFSVFLYERGETHRPKSAKAYWH